MYERLKKTNTPDNCGSCTVKGLDTCHVKFLNHVKTQKCCKTATFINLFDLVLKAFWNPNGSINLVTKSLNLRGGLSVTDPTRRQHLIKIFPGVAMWDRGRRFKVDLKIANKINWTNFKYYTNQGNMNYKAFSRYSCISQQNSSYFHCDYIYHAICGVTALMTRSMYLWYECM